jgi:hypothetical protein
MYQQLLGYKVEGKIYLEVRERIRLNITDLEHTSYLCKYVKTVFFRTKEVTINYVCRYHKPSSLMRISNVKST